MENKNKNQFDPTEVLKLIKQVDDHRLGEQKDVVVFLGITGAGKSTLVHFLYGDDTKLTAEHVNPENPTGVFRIADEAKKIIHGIESKTFLVDFIIDNDTAYYDCPGFEDTRNANYDMASNYMVHKVLEGAKRIKFIYVVNYSSVKDGTDRKDFMSLLKHASQSIKNIDNYTNSIGLMVNKVDNEVTWDGGVAQLVSENNIKRNVIQFLEKDVKNKIETNPCLYQENNFGNIAIKILNIFLKRSNGDYKNIGLFKRPCEAGILSTMTDMQKAKQNIKSMIARLQFSPSNINDFAFSISEASINNLHLMVREIDRQVMNLMTEMCKNVKHSLAAQMENLDYFDLNTKITNLLPKVNDTLQSLKNSANMENFMTEFLILLEEMRFEMDEKTDRDIKSFCGFTHFVHKVTNGKNYNVNFFCWSDQVNGIRHFLHEFLSWNRFMKELYSQTSIDNEIKTFDDINESNLKNLVDLIKSKIPTLTSLIDVNLNMDKELKIKDLKNFLKIISEPTSENFSRGGDERIAIIKAENFYLSRLSTLIQEKKSLKEIRIYAYNTVFFDADIQATGKELKLIILAPTWEVSGKKVIVLDGSPARNLYSTRADENTAGKTGEPGGAAGCFFGLVNSVVNGHLEIRANGGIGGDGQDGGHGSKGQDATTEGAPTSECVLNENTSDRTLMFLNVGKDTRTRIKKTWSGTEGRSGARGGAGGKGGCKGGIEIYGNYEGYVSLLCEDGANGKPGSGGEGGAGGKTVDKIVEKKMTSVGSTTGEVIKIGIGSVLAHVPFVNMMGLASAEEQGSRKNETKTVETKTIQESSGKKCDEISYEGLVEPPQAELIINYDEILREYRKLIHNMLNNKYRSDNLKKIVQCIDSRLKNNI